MWEIQALIRGSKLKQLDEQEAMAQYAFHLRYVLNDKKPKLKKIFNKEKLEARIKKMFSRNEPKQDKETLREKARQAIDYFKNRR